MRLTFALTLMLTVATPAAFADAWRLEPLDETLAGSQFGQSYANRQFSVATAINNNGHLVGYQRTAESQYRSFGITTSDNPALTIVDTPDFVALSAGDAACFWLFCATEFPFGIQIGESGALTSFVGADAGSAVIPDSLPFSRFPGSFVEENAHGIVATTQYGNDDQAGFLVGDFGVTALSSVRWLVAINDNQPAQVLGHVGVGGDCQVFGYGCEPAPRECDDDDDGHSNDRGVGHHSHGRGHGYGHDDCHEEHDTASNDTGGAGYPVLLAMDADGGAAPLLFPMTTEEGPITRAFPLALNNDTAVLRASIGDDGANRLLVCHFQASSLDANADGRVDCAGGLVPVAVDGDRDLLTVLGFSLNNDGLLLGNGGFSAAGLGLPMVADLNTDAPRLTLLANHLGSDRQVQLSVVTDVNNEGMASGYGFADCGDQPEAVRLLPAEPLPGAIRFVPGSLEMDTLIRPGQNYTLSPQAAGASGSALFRYALFDRTSGQWQTVQDWSAGAYQGSAPASETDLCVRVEVADSLDMSQQREQLLRYRVSDEPAPTTYTPATPGGSLPSTPGDALSEALPQIGAFSYLLLVLVLGCKRRAQAA
jgi:hypothetical protein